MINLIVMYRSVLVKCRLHYIYYNRTMRNHAKRLSSGLSPKRSEYLSHAIKDIKNKGTFNGTQIVKKIYKVKDSHSAGSISTEILKDKTVREIIQKALEANHIQVHDLIAELAPIAKAPINTKTITPEL